MTQAQAVIETIEKLGGIDKLQMTNFSYFCKKFIMLKRRNHKSIDLIAKEIAESHDMLEEYSDARKHGLSPIEALEDWDLLDKQAEELIKKAIVSQR